MPPSLKRKLVIAALAICLIMAVEMFPDFVTGGWSEKILCTVTFGFGVWLAFFGVYRSAWLQLMWGWVCLIGSAAITWTICAQTIHGRAAFEPRSMDAVLPWIGMVVAGYLLVIDRQVARYRAERPKQHDRLGEHLD